ncbi:MAG: hypothetical protein LBL93_05955 [Ruminococcus sp.]|jgi:hypothetical protein|nr:hypothetical protein [Ruminococcus sp.]
MKIIKNGSIISVETCIECPFYSIQNRRNGRGVCGVYAVPMYQGSFCKKGIVIKYDNCFFNCNDCVHYDWYGGICKQHKEMLSIKFDVTKNCDDFEIGTEEYRKGYNPPSEEEQRRFLEKHPENPDITAENERIKKANFEYKQRPESEFPVVYVFADYINSDEKGMYINFPDVFCIKLKDTNIAEIQLIGRTYDFEYDKRNLNTKGKIETLKSTYIIRINSKVFKNTDIQINEPVTVAVSFNE